MCLIILILKKYLNERDKLIPFPSFVTSCDNHCKTKSSLIILINNQPFLPISSTSERLWIKVFVWDLLIWRKAPYVLGLPWFREGLVSIRQSAEIKDYYIWDQRQETWDAVLFNLFYVGVLKAFLKRNLYCFRNIFRWQYFNSILERIFNYLRLFSIIPIHILLDG